MNSEKNTTYDVIVVGGGASGMMTALEAASRGKHVLLLEKNKTLGKKLSITGGGRCNITNNEQDVRAFLAHYGKAEQFLYSAFSQFGVKETFSFFESKGLPLVTQGRNRVFPKTEKATDVCALFIKELQKHNVTIMTDCAVQKLEIKDKTITHVITKKGTYAGTSVVIATGGLSHGETGSTGDGFAWLEALGHTVHEPTPNIVPLKVDNQWVKDLAGTSLEHTKITFFVEINGTQKKVFSMPKKGSDPKGNKILCTHFGLSGPLILNSSKQIGDMMYEGQVTATIDCYPEKNLGELETHIIEIFDANKNKALKNVFVDIAPTGTAKVLLTLLPHIDPLMQVNSVKKEQRKELVHLLKNLPVNIIGLMGFDRAVVADGGVSIEEVDTRTMRSKIINNLYMTGDILDIERPSGGYSLQLCWTTGFVAGNSVGNKTT